MEKKSIVAVWLTGGAVGLACEFAVIDGLRSPWDCHPGKDKELCAPMTAVLPHVPEPEPYAPGPTRLFASVAASTTMTVTGAGFSFTR